MKKEVNGIISMNYIPKDEVEWRETKVLKINEEGPADQHPYKYRLMLPIPLAEWDVFDYWERERFDSMEQHLKQGDVLFDIGTEQGWCNLIYAQFVGPENMVLIEPTPEFWPNIKETWLKNFPRKLPKAYYDGLFSAETTDKRKNVNFGSWPQAAYGDLIDRNSYKYIHEHGDVVPQITIDEYVRRSKVVPTALTMDTEGSELIILRGAAKTLKAHHPKVWVSIHPEMSVEWYNTTKDDLLKFMEKLGYEAEHLATDHEEHWYFYAS